MILQTNISGILSLFFSLSFADILHNFSNTCIIIHHSNICWKLTYSKDIFSKFQLSLIFFFFTFYNKFSKFHSFFKKNKIGKSRSSSRISNLSKQGNFLYKVSIYMKVSNEHFFLFITCIFCTMSCVFKNLYYNGWR